MKILRKIMLSSLLLSLQTLFTQDAFANTEKPVENQFLTQATHANLNNFRIYLEDTIWIVPPSTLLAYEYVDGKNVRVKDQTVWVIHKFNKGYFFGDSYTSLNNTPSSHAKFVGTVTPFGDVFITFYPKSEKYGTKDVVTGTGKFTNIGKDRFFVMQMNSAQNAKAGLSHWSYMIKVQKNDDFYKNLPGVDMNVEDFISQF